MSHKDMLKTPLKTKHFFEVLPIAKLECVLDYPRHHLQFIGDNIVIYSVSASLNRAVSVNLLHLFRLNET